MKTLLLIACFCLLPALVHAQQVPQGGYWNLETNLITRDHTVVRFYDAQDQLVYETRLNDLCLDLSRGNGLCRRTAQKLNLALQTVLLNPRGAEQAVAALSQQLGQNRRVQRIYAVR
ncbi:hypothetical protein [Hymenobacter sp. CRA2]|uniref:hypothetical protein n=1 Tax=Hymenobacter sp. CRA2 TaxID=1955620 RepID=UPI00098FD092|nr:hypothetical protein [Hymenobacter sp. CRA2]OON69429.1 hypothetical protein B0919_09130 [Hymenobacter sp. CRA2]